MKFYRCNICGNLVELINYGGGELVCCGEPMEELTPKTSDEGKEKHLPVIEQEGSKITVKVGSIPHPMTEEHYIEWIIIAYNNKVLRAKLTPNVEPEVIFDVDEAFDKIEAYAYCNIHGLWKATHNA